MKYSYFTLNTHKIFYTNCCTGLVSYDGWCGTGDNTDVIIGQTEKDSYSACENKCYEYDECTAFSYETTADPKYYNCQIYKGGPYTHGDGKTNTKCYIRPGDFLSFFKYAVLWRIKPYTLV